MPYDKFQRFEANLKKGEAMYEGRHRGRIIFNPPDIVKVVLGCVNWNLIHLLKKKTKEFVSGCSLKTLSENMEKFK